MKAALLFLIIALTFHAKQANAYATYNRLGYISCTACHFLRTGGGLLTPYGQSVSAAMAAKSEEVSPNEEHVYHGIQARIIEMDSSTRANPFLMQADYLISALATQSVRVDAQVGPNLKRGNSFASLPSGWDRVVLRKGMISAELNDTHSIELGRDAPVSALNLDDHTALLRQQNRNGLFDYPTQFRYVFQTEKIQILPYLMAPSFEEKTENREYGGGIRSEYLLNNSNSIGATGMLGKSPVISRFALSTFFRLSEDHWNGIMGEYLFTQMYAEGVSNGFSQQNAYIRPYVAAPEWVESSVVFEFQKVSEPFSQIKYQYGPEVVFRLHRFVSLIGDGKKLIWENMSNWSWYGQILLHFQI